MQEIQENKKSHNNYEYVDLSYKNDLNRIKLPKFQRSLVWSKKKKLDLLSTLHKDFPFGVLLVAPSKKDDQGLNLLDGQQRLSTINDYANNRVLYWKNLNRSQYNDVFNKLNDIIVGKGSDALDEELFDKLLDVSTDLADWTDDYDNFHKKTKQGLRKIVRDVRKEISEYINLDSLKIPVIKFLGDSSDLPEVYENLNKGGTPLTKYEIFNAAWSNDFIKLPEFKEADEILEFVKDYYTDILSKGGFEIENFSEDEITNTRKINLAEFGRALGKFVVKRIPSLVSNTDTSAINELGFGILGIATGVSNKNIANVKENADTIRLGLRHILEQTELISNKLNDAFQGILKQHISHSGQVHSKKPFYATQLSTSFKILSYFASFWDLSSDEMNKPLRNIPAYYVYDYLNGNWTAHGDQRLNEYYPGDGQMRNYDNPVEKDAFHSAFLAWIGDNPGIRKTFSRDVQSLITIHSNLTYLSTPLPEKLGEDFEFEHIIPKGKVVANNEKVPNINLSSLGNGMLLPKSTNNKKKDHTIYEYNIDESEKKKLLSSIAGANYPSLKDFERIFALLEKKDYEKINTIIRKRAIKVADDIISGLVK